MARDRMTPLGAAVAFIDAVNRGDLEALVALLHPEHRLELGDEAPVVGRPANRAAWQGYLDAFPGYVIEPRHLVTSGGRVGVLGSTVGSHLGLPDEQERELPVLWEAEVVDGLLTRWAIVEDTPATRAELGLPVQP